ncbi:MAG TPA: flagellar biosynthetic protein FliR [Terriglobales bacterium]|nr:flagellar biosynthetic protein FliR [Terriglobales bacterium]
MIAAVPDLRIDRALLAWMLALARISGVLVSAPFLGSASVAPRLKIGLGIFLAMLLTPLVRTPELSGAPFSVVFLLVQELGIGALMGLMLQLFFDAAQLAGQVCGVQMGYSLASVLNPDSQADSTVLSTLYQLTVLVLFIQLNVPHWLVRGLARSFDYLPPGRLTLGWPSTSGVLHFASGMWIAGVQIAAPVLVASLFADVALGFLGKASPQFPVLFLGISLKNLLGLGLLVGSVVFWPQFFDVRFERALEASERVLKLAH